jgi:hypothetical protein
MKKIINTSYPNINKEFSKKLYEGLKEKTRKTVEDVSSKVHPNLGQTVRKINNLSDTIENFNDSLNNGIFRTLFSKEVQNLELADHLFVQRIGYTHHGIYVGNGKVIHYLLESVKVDTLEVFADGAKIHKKSNEESYLSYSQEEAVNRAYSRCAENNYNLIINNCESFVRWCRNGSSHF